MHVTPLGLFTAELEPRLREAASTVEGGDLETVFQAFMEAATGSFKELIEASVVGDLGYWNGQYRVRVLQGAMQAAAEGHFACYVEVDIGNLNGMNRALGHSKCNELVFIAIARILRDSLQGAKRIVELPVEEQRTELTRLIGEDYQAEDDTHIIGELCDSWIEMFRHGGDELSFIIVGYHPRLVTALMDSAYREIAAHEERENLKFAVHPKHVFGFEQHWGLRISFGISEIRPDLSVSDILSAADKRVEEMKSSGYVTYSRGTGKEIVNARRYKRFDYPRLWLLALQYLLKG